MANHAYVVPGRKPTVEEVDAVVRKVVAGKFPMLDLELKVGDKDAWSQEATWILRSPEDDQFAIVFWFGDHWLSKPDPSPKVVLQPDVHEGMDKVFAVEFRHGHSWRILWWIEWEIRNAVAKALGARMYDDAYYKEGGEAPLNETYPSYVRYMKACLAREGRVRRAVLMAMERSEMNTAPESVRELYGGRK